MYLLASEKSHRGFIFLSGYQTVIFCNILLVNLIRFSVQCCNVQPVPISVGGEFERRRVDVVVRGVQRFPKEDNLGQCCRIGMNGVSAEVSSLGWDIIEWINLG